MPGCAAPGLFEAQCPGPVRKPQFAAMQATSLKRVRAHQLRIEILSLADPDDRHVRVAAIRCVHGAGSP